MVRTTSSAGEVLETGGGEIRRTIQLLVVSLEGSESAFLLAPLLTRFNHSCIDPRPVEQEGSG